MNQCIHIFSMLNFVSDGPNKEIYIKHTHGFVARIVGEFIV